MESCFCESPSERCQDFWVEDMSANGALYELRLTDKSAKHQMRAQFEQFGMRQLVAAFELPTAASMGLDRLIINSAH